MSGVADEGSLQLDRGETSESALVSTSVVGVFDPVGDRVVQLCSGSPRSGVQDVALQQCPERFHGGVVTC